MEQIPAFRKLIAGRERRVPLAYLRGTQEFYGIDLTVGPAVMTPRPETELLVELAVERLRELPAGRADLVDVGTGSGAIAIAVLRKRPEVNALGIDISSAALAVARENARTAGSPQLRLIRGDMLSPVADRSIDLVVSNPPYIPSAEIAGLQQEVRDHEPRIALDGGPDGLRYFSRLVEAAPRILRPGGWLAVEVGEGQAPAVRQLMETAGHIHVETRRDLAGIERVVCAQRP